MLIFINEIMIIVNQLTAIAGKNLIYTKHDIMYSYMIIILFRTK